MSNPGSSKVPEHCKHTGSLDTLTIPLTMCTLIPLTMCTLILTPLKAEVLEIEDGDR